VKVTMTSPFLVNLLFRCMDFFFYASTPCLVYNHEVSQMKCNHEITLHTGKKLERELEDTVLDDAFKKSLVDLLTCARCSTVVINTGQYERLENSMAEIYHDKGYYKRYRVYRRKLE